MAMTFSNIQNSFLDLWFRKYEPPHTSSKEVNVLCYSEIEYVWDLDILIPP